MVLTECVSVARLVPNANIVNINTNMPDAVNTTVIQDLETNCCWYITMVEMIGQGFFFFFFFFF